MSYLENPIDVIVTLTIFAGNGFAVSKVRRGRYSSSKAFLQGALWGGLAIISIVAYAATRPFLIDEAQFTLARADISNWQYLLIASLVILGSGLSCQGASSASK